MYFCHILLLRVLVFFSFYSSTTIFVSKFLSPNPNCEKLYFLNLNIHVINYAKPHSITFAHLLIHILYFQQRAESWTNHTALFNIHYSFWFCKASLVLFFPCYLYLILIPLSLKQKQNKTKKPLYCMYNIFVCILPQLYRYFLCMTSLFIKMVL